MRVLHCYEHTTGWRVFVKTQKPGELVGCEVIITDTPYDDYLAGYDLLKFGSVMHSTKLMDRAIIQMKMADEVFLVSHVHPTGCISVEWQRSPALPHDPEQPYDMLLEDFKMFSSDREAVASVLASESRDPYVRAALVLTLTARYKGRAHEHLSPGRHQGGRSAQFATAATPTASAFAVYDAIKPLADGGLTFYGATSCFEWDVQDRMSRLQPARYKTPLALHASWLARGEKLVKVYRGWCFYR
jgi:hypothetical protein